MTKSVSVTRRLSEAELDHRLKTADSEAIVRRLGFLKNLYQGDTVPEASAREGRSKSTGYSWLQDWNEGGLEALYPDQRSGRPPKLTAAEEDKFLEQIEQRQPVSTATIESILHDKFDVEYATDYLPRKLEALGLVYEPPARETVDRQAVVGAIEWDEKAPVDGTEKHPYNNQSSRLEAGWRLAK
jgi:putative transposase